MSDVTDSVLDAFAASLSAAPGEYDDTTVAQAAVLLSDHLALLGAAAGVAPAAAAATAAASESAPLDERWALEAELGAAADRDDVHWIRLVHPGSIVWPTVLGLGRELNLSGAAVLRAAIIGYESTVRLAAVIPAGSSHLTALAATVGASAAASAVLDPSGRVDANALGHAISVAGGSTGAFRERSGTRQFHRAHAVRTGIAAARAAARGLTATRTDLEFGGGAWAGSRAAELDCSVIDGWAIRTTSVRVFPTSGWNQQVFEAVRAAATGLSGDLVSIALTVPRAVLDRSIATDSADSDPWNSIQHAAAEAAGTVLGDPRGAAVLRALVATSEGPVTTALVSTTGGSGESSVSLPSGHPERPAAIDDLAAAWGLGTETAEHQLAEFGALLRSHDPGSIPPDPLTRRSEA